MRCKVIFEVGGTTEIVIAVVRIIHSSYIYICCLKCCLHLRCDLFVRLFIVYRPPAFVQVGDWTYPLVPGRSPVLKCTNGAYVFPDVADTTASRPGSVGVVISAALDPSYREIYESILSNYGVLQVRTIQI